MKKITRGFEIDYDEWFDLFLPVANFSSSACGPSLCNGDGELLFGFETYGKDLEHVIKIARESPNHVWTLIEEDNGSLVLVAGYQVVNRLTYLITENPWTNPKQFSYQLKSEVSCDNCGWSGPADNLVIGILGDFDTPKNLCPSCGCANNLSSALGGEVEKPCLLIAS